MQIGLLCNPATVRITNGPPILRAQSANALGWRLCRPSADRRQGLTEIFRLFPFPQICGHGSWLGVERSLEPASGRPYTARLPFAVHEQQVQDIVSHGELLTSRWPRRARPPRTQRRTTTRRTAKASALIKSRKSAPPFWELRKRAWVRVKRTVRQRPSPSSTWAAVRL
jgi:hypothetical protein